MLFKIFQSLSNDPYLNLSIEEYLLTCYWQDENIVFFYRNDPCVVLGRFQNPWRECRPSYLIKKKIPLLRRISGGGAVYHDKGNLNFSIITGRKGFSRNTYINKIQQGLSSLGITTECVHNNSITISGHKISGSAFRYMKKRVLHHGTILVHSHLQALNKCLVPALKNGTCTGGTDSTRYDVVNIDTIVPGLTIKKMMNILAVAITQKKHIHIENVRGKIDWEILHTLLEKNKSFEWIYGQTPQSEVTLSLDNEKCHSKCIILIVKGRIRNIMIPGFSQLSEKVTQKVKGLPFISSELIQELKAMHNLCKEKNILFTLIEKIRIIRI